MDEIGCEMFCYTDFLYPGQSRHRMHGPEESYGSELVRQLESAIRDEPRIELRTDTPVEELLWDGSRVTGVETADGTTEAGAVILALNGFGGDREMVRSTSARRRRPRSTTARRTTPVKASGGASLSERRQGT